MIEFEKNMINNNIKEPENNNDDEQNRREDYENLRSKLSDIVDQELYEDIERNVMFAETIERSGETSSMTNEERRQFRRRKAIEDAIEMMGVSTINSSKGL